MAGTAQTAPPEVVVGVATFRRPAALARLLPELVAQLAAYEGRGSVVVVDNDPQGGAADQVAGWADQGVRYVHEPRPGIAAARNRALASAGRAALLLFVDDDGLPTPGWLDRMVAAWGRWHPAAVSGPAVPRFEQGEPDPWVAGSGVFGADLRPTGTRVGGASTANLLLDLAWLRAHGLRFDEAFGLTGGSDTMLTHALVAAGGEIRWCDEAEVLDFHSVDRMTRAWVRRRSYRTGNDWSRAALALRSPGPRPAGGTSRRVARGAVRGATGLTNQVRGALGRDVGRRARGACQVSTALGVVGGALGVVSVEYGSGPRRADVGAAQQPAGGEQIRPLGRQDEQEQANPGERQPAGEQQLPDRPVDEAGAHVREQPQRERGATSASRAWRSRRRLSSPVARTIQLSETSHWKRVRDRVPDRDADRPPGQPGQDEAHHRAGDEELPQLPPGPRARGRPSRRSATRAEDPADREHREDQRDRVPGRAEQHQDQGPDSPAATAKTVAVR